MREALFRANTAIIGAKPENSMWVQGDLVHIDDTTYINVDKLLVRVEPHTVGQFTGIADKNGVRIFEGDIVKAHDHLPSGINDFIGVVEYREGSFAIVGTYAHYRWMDYEIEIIGNRFDNPELLE